MKLNGFFKLGKQIVMLKISVFIFLALFSCASVDPAKVDVQLEESAPEEKVTTFTESLIDLGLMTEIYGTGVLRVQSNSIGDNTGTSGSTGGEIPRDITEMLKSTLNSIGGNVVYIPYDPAFIQNMNVTGYSSFEDKLIPDVVISGGITEFDRGLSTRGENTNAGVEASVSGLPSWVPSDSVGIEYGDGGKAGLARITIDFNMLDFKTMAGIPRMNTVNSMEVHKALAEKNLGITLFGATFGRKGSIKKVQGRHAAVRMLVEVSMIQMLGKYLAIPYWRFLGDDAKPDPVVLRQIKAYYYKLTPADRIANIQQWLYLHGSDLNFTGQLDQDTVAGIKKIVPGFAGNAIDVDTFIKVYISIPIDESVVARRNVMNTKLSGTTMPTVEPQTQQVQPQQTQQAQQAQQPQPQPQPQKQVQRQQQPKQQAQAPSSKPQKRKAGIGSMLSDEDW